MDVDGDVVEHGRCTVGIRVGVMGHGNKSMDEVRDAMTGTPSTPTNFSVCHYDLGPDSKTACF